MSENQENRLVDPNVPADQGLSALGLLMQLGGSLFAGIGALGLFQFLILAGRARREHAQPRSAINAYLAAVHAEATRRGYAFDRGKFGPARAVASIAVSDGQLAHEWAHLQRKLAARSPAVHAQWAGVSMPQCHPLFRRGPGPVALWERVGEPD